MSNSQQNKQSVLSFINLLIASIIIFIVVIISLSNLLENPTSRRIRQAAEKNLRLFARGNSLNAINCNSFDDKQNGWVECRATDRKGQFVPLYCPYNPSQNECRYNIKK